ncbi:hypothetical protein HanRHA438_Chr10g0464291 [Helianthus annuus]|nr:hypothetical protein HanRHA438_Chr10g0464291 [Helianthus annuus]
MLESTMYVWKDSHCQILASSQPQRHQVCKIDLNITKTAMRQLHHLRSYDVSFCHIICIHIVQHH